ncbi:hypothetical protein JZ751_003705 [Albula glossodonta]|uniref:Cytochrome P450 2K1-like n=1 Tax=Albula glossodonta TaxID=121402 RepID=A0A8T2MYT1_9TELE|nr:hypothetical protein JZ751_003705 [Albula glossodonta]
MMVSLRELLLETPPPWALLGLVLVLVLFYAFCSGHRVHREPPGPWPLPLLGNLLLLDLKKPYASLHELSKKYGPVFSVHLGPKKVVVLAGYKTVKQALVNFAEEFGDRDIPPILRETLEGNGVLFANGDSWKEMRRFSLSTLRDFGMGKRGSEEKIVEEAHHLIKVFEQFKGEPFNTCQPLHFSVSNVISSIVYGSRFNLDDPSFQKMVTRANESVRLLGSAEVQVYNLFPWLGQFFRRWLANRAKMLKNTENNNENVNKLVRGLQETLSTADRRGLVDAFLIRQQEETGQPGSYFHNRNLVSVITNLFAAGADTTGATLRWSLLLMAKYPHIQDRVQEELSRVIGDREPRVEDRKDLPYTDAVIHETQRLANVVPLSVAHTTSCDVTFQGFFVKKGTTVIPLLTSVLHDECEWETPHSFNPAHFLDEEGCFVKRDAFMPFSAGRRACLGESLARMELFLFFTFLLQKFRFLPPPGMAEEELDLTPAVGFTLTPSPHLLCAVSRA